ncbi:Innexin unc-9, partial [Lamellibrachia satsuma]
FSPQVCWTTNTYYLPFTQDRIPKPGASRGYIGYYQWVSLILSCQAVLFYLPRPIWRLFSKKSGIAVSTITDAAIECQRKSDADSRDKTIRYMTKHMGRFLLEMSRNEIVAPRRCKGFLWGIYGNYLIVLYIFIKLVYILNVVVQIFLLNVFLGMDYSWYGFNVFSRMLRGVEWTTSDRFPRVTLCDFQIRELGNINRYTVQCSLPVNLFNEKIFIFLWFWFAFVAFATTGSLVMWLGSSFVMPNQVRYIKARLISMETIRYKSKEAKEVDRFVRCYLRRDGLFLIRLVSKNASDIIAAELISGLWGHFQDHK